MAYTQDDLTKLQKAISKGAAEVQLDGERVRFRSLDEMLRLERKIQAELGVSERPTRRMHYPKTSTGWR